MKFAKKKFLKQALTEAWIYCKSEEAENEIKSEEFIKRQYELED